MKRYKKKYEAQEHSCRPVLNEQRRRAILDLLKPSGPGSGPRTLPPLRDLAGYDSERSRGLARSRDGPPHSRRRPSLSRRRARRSHAPRERKAPLRIADRAASMVKEARSSFSTPAPPPRRSRVPFAAFRI